MVSEEKISIYVQYKSGSCHLTIVGCNRYRLMYLCSAQCFVEIKTPHHGH
jgi:hypothetical protein